MKTISKELPICLNQGSGLDLRLKLSVDGKEVLSTPGHSFTMPFLYMLFGMASNQDAHGFLAMDDIDFLLAAPANNRYFSISSVTVDSGAGTTFIDLNGDAFAYDDTDFEAAINNEDAKLYIVIWDAQGNTDLNGQYEVDFNFSRGRDKILINQALGVQGNYTGGGKAVCFLKKNWNMNNSAYSQAYGRWSPIVGEGSTPVTIEDLFLEDRIDIGSGSNQLVHGSTQISVRTDDKPSSRFILTRTFTNQSGAAIDVTEVGIKSQLEAIEENWLNDAATFLARDLLPSPVTIGAGSTLTLDYEVIVRLFNSATDTDVDGTNGGFLINFAEMLRQFALGNDPRHDFDMSYSGGGLAGGENNGIHVGTDNKFVSMTDAGALGRIMHGQDVGQLLHHGMLIDNPVIDNVNGEAYFRLGRIFENLSGGSITIGEIALRKDGPMARTALAPVDQVTVDPGEFVKVDYTVKIKTAP